MRLAVLGDIHCNHYAFKACYDWILAHDIDGVVFLGDYVADYPCPQKTMQMLYELKAAYPTWFVLGNREEFLLEQWDIEQKFGKSQLIWKPTQGTLRYTYEHLLPEDFTFFSTMPPALDIHIEGYPRFSISHGDLHKCRANVKPDTEIMEQLLSEMKGQLHFCAHTHISFIYEKNGKTVINPGSVGRSFTDYSKAEMAVMESDGGQWQETLLSLDYDVQSEIEEFISSKMLEQSDVWAQCVCEVLRTGRDYCAECIALVQAYVKKSEGEMDDIKLWERAAGELGIL